MKTPSIFRTKECRMKEKEEEKRENKKNGDESSLHLTAGFATSCYYWTRII